MVFFVADGLCAKEQRCETWMDLASVPGAQDECGSDHD
jgi:hypothetical protein